MNDKSVISNEIEVTGDAIAVTVAFSEGADPIMMVRTLAVSILDNKSRRVSSIDIMVGTPYLPRLGETVIGDAWWWKPGGKGGNQAVAAARSSRYFFQPSSRSRSYWRNSRVSEPT